MTDVRIQQPRDVLTMDIDHIPHHIVYLHKLARLGKASRYGFKLNRVCQFDVDEALVKNWDGLKDVERVTLIYREKEGV